MTERDETGRSWHDMGGRDAGPINRAEHDYALWEKRVDALMVLTGHLFTVDAMRRALEDMGEDVFEKHSYYDRWVAALARNLIEAGVITPDELNARMAEVEARGPTYGEAQGAVP